MSRILVSGLINIETTLRVESFPLPYFPVTYPFGGIDNSVSGVGFNIAKALTRLGHEVTLLSFVGRDPAGELAKNALHSAGLDTSYVRESDATAQSVILYDKEGRRQIHVDLKSHQEIQYPAADFSEAAARCDLAILCNINFSRPLLAEAKKSGLPIYTDVHALASVNDAYNNDFMDAADTLFVSHERMEEPPHEFARKLHEAHGTRVIVVGMGRDGALLSLRAGHQAMIPAVSPRPVVNTIGAGDALFSGYVHGVLGGLTETEALRCAVVYAGYKVGSVSAADGLIDAQDYAGLCVRLRPEPRSIPGQK